MVDITKSIAPSKVQSTLYTYFQHYWAHRSNERNTSTSNNSRSAIV